jgi:hypothetical protein
MVAKSLLGILFTSVKYTNSLFLALAPEISIKASRVNYKTKGKVSEIIHTAKKEYSVL